MAAAINSGSSSLAKFDPDSARVSPTMLIARFLTTEQPDSAAAANITTRTRVTVLGDISIRKGDLVLYPIPPARFPLTPCGMSACVILTDSRREVTPSAFNPVARTIYCAAP